MNTVVGDPLYRPGLYWKNQEFSLDRSSAPAKGEPAAVTEGRAYWKGAQIWRADGSKAGSAALDKSGTQLRSGRIFEGLGLLEAAAGDGALAHRAFEQATRYYTNPSDAIRVVIDEARFLAQSGRTTEAAALLVAGQHKFIGKPAASALEEVLAEISTPKP